ncbi:helix-turn-helix domain-containing protein [Rhodococcus tukisamuensis]|uniref:Helix-turn-helix domain-containing protein n=1 Tax=Rhodococcus tukisamuensis TaxID=168276 RepID=A0A1G6W6G7_9NOCA|nr:helix-turn-helix domain-containing protein [Rhodococcus tukisamuensis]SDD60635.1 Helix-turn-helix domain-containing protein [Rhodococcus tukisamuensis]
MYRERASRISGAVLWTSESVADAEHRILPDGSMDVIWLGGRLVVAGPDTIAHMSTPAETARIVGLRFAPGQGPAALGAPADGLVNTRVPLAELWNPVRVRRWESRLSGSPAPGRLLEQLAGERLDEAAPDLRLLATATGLLRAGAPVASVGARVGLSERQLHRRSVRAYGYGPKTLSRILRFGRAVEMVRAGTSPAAVAARLAYADQAHLAREVRQLAGVPLGALG